MILLCPEESGGFEQVRLLKRVFAKARILKFTNQVSWSCIHEAFTKGAGGYLEKENSPLKLIEDVQELYTGVRP